MRKIEDLNVYETEALKVLVNNYRLYKRSQDDLQYIFGLSIYLLLDIHHEAKKPIWLKDLLTDEFIEKLTQHSKVAKK